jgi:hypothetical protein
MGEILYTTQFGSRLFGTSTPSSDTDIKHIELPDIQGLLVGRRIVNRVVKTNTVEDTKNGPDDIDTEFIPIQSLARDFYEGQTYALEIAFSIDGSHARQTHYDRNGQACPMDQTSQFCQFVSELRANFLTSNISAMMGYVVNQANLYSFKGERLNAAKAVKQLLSTGMDDLTIDAMMAAKDQTFAAAARKVALDYPKYFTIETYDISAGRRGPCFKMLEKIMPWSIKISKAHEMVAGSIKKYGDRAKAASADNVDWKATMHAVRIVDEGLALLKNHRIDLPHPPERAERLLSIRRGEVPLDEIRQELEAKLDQLKELSITNTLPPISSELTSRFDHWLESWMLRFYGLSKRPTLEPSTSTRPRISP